MKKTLAYLTAATLYFLPTTQAKSEFIGPDLLPVTSSKSVFNKGQKDELQWMSHRVMRRTTYREFAHNSKCPWQFVPNINYSLVGVKNDTLETVLDAFEKSGVKQDTLDSAEKKWDYFFKSHYSPKDMVFELGQAGDCYIPPKPKLPKYSNIKN